MADRVLKGDYDMKMVSKIYISSFGATEFLRVGVVCYFHIKPNQGYVELWFDKILDNEMQVGCAHTFSPPYSSSLSSPSHSVHMTDSSQPQHFFAAGCLFADFSNTVIFYPVIKSL